MIDICAENSENGAAKITATFHCMDCNENLCDDCGREHKRQRLSRNHHIVVLDDQLKARLMKINKIDRSINKDIFCDFCAENSENGAAKIIASWHCIDCDENQCDDCSREHKRQRLSKSHQCVVLDDQMKVKLVKAKQMAKSTEVYVFCDICKENNEIGKGNIAATLQCIDCSENQCEDCNKEHKRQRLFKNHQIAKLDTKMKRNSVNLRHMTKELDLEKVCGEKNELRKTWAAATWPSIDRDENQCKNCSNEHKGQWSLRNHQILLKNELTKKNMSKMTHDTELLCDMCSANGASHAADTLKATLYCIDCEENQCEECSRLHLRQMSSREHRVIALNEQTQQRWKYLRTCKVHIKEQLKVYCFTCQQVTCMKCIDAEHNSHEYQLACTVLYGLLSDIDGYLVKVDSWLQLADVTKHELETKCLDTANVSRVNRKSGHGCTWENLRSSKEHQLNMRIEMKKELDNHLESMHAFKRQCNSLKTHNSSIDICFEVKELRIKFEELQLQQELCSPERLFSAFGVAGRCTL